MADLNEIAKDNYRLGFNDAIQLAEKETKTNLSHLQEKMDINNAPKRYGSGVWSGDI